MSDLNERLRACSVSTVLGWDRHTCGIWTSECSVLACWVSDESLSESLLLITRVHIRMTTRRPRFDRVPTLPPLKSDCSQAEPKVAIGPFLGRALVSRLSFCVDMMLALGAMCVAEFSPQTLSSTGLDADMEKLNEYIQADKTNEQSVETLYADLQHRFSVMKVRVDT